MKRSIAKKTPPERPQRLDDRGLVDLVDPVLGFEQPGERLEAAARARSARRGRAGGARRPSRCRRPRSGALTIITHGNGVLGVGRLLLAEVAASRRAAVAGVFRDLVRQRERRALAEELAEACRRASSGSPRRPRRWPGRSAGGSSAAARGCDGRGRRGRATVPVGCVAVVGGGLGQMSSTPDAGGVAGLDGRRRWRSTWRRPGHAPCPPWPPAGASGTTSGPSKTRK